MVEFCIVFLFCCTDRIEPLFILQLHDTKHALYAQYAQQLCFVFTGARGNTTNNIEWYLGWAVNIARRTRRTAYVCSIFCAMETYHSGLELVTFNHAPQSIAITIAYIKLTEILNFLVSIRNFVSPPPPRMRSTSSKIFDNTFLI